MPLAGVAIVACVRGRITVVALPLSGPRPQSFGIHVVFVGVYSS